MFVDEFVEKIEAELGGVVEVTDIGGGDISKAAKIVTKQGCFFVKWNDKKLPGLFTGEAVGLRLLARAKEIRVPEVMLVDDDFGVGMDGFSAKRKAKN